MITVEEALQSCFALVSPLPGETVDLRQAAGRVLLHPATARLTQPPFDASAMDGYALGRAAAAGASYTVIGEAGAGHSFAGRLSPDQATRIFTGAPVPQGAETIAIQEDVTVSGPRITVTTATRPGDNIRKRGQDFAIGEALAAPRRLRANDLALLAAMNIAHVTIARRPVVAFIATGDELVMPGDTPGPDQIVASNLFALEAMARAEGAETRLLPIARDNEPALRQVFALAAGADLIVTIGGASVGDHDLVCKVAADLGLQRAFWKIAMRPGKPLMAGRMGQSLMLGLPGNPVSAIVCGHLFLLPMLRAMQGLPAAASPTARAVLAEDVGPAGPRVHYMRARLTQTDGLPQITPFTSQDSALLRILTEADALLIRPLGDGPRRAGEVVDYLPL
ncbi:MAG: molybdopterin molybdotransferase MoeA [Pseudorhodobacter sp.]|nr:MAG: molybdopterin molybdotransferase MoeA [Pseudorhodobacter sp.]